MGSFTPIVAVTFWGVCASVAGIIALVYLVSLPETYRERRLRRTHLATHAAMTDDDFVRRAGIPPERASVAVRVRHVIAEAMRVPPETLHPSDELISYISQFSFDGMDVEWDIGWPLEDELEVEIPDDFWERLVADRKGPVPTAGVLARRIAEEMQSFAPLQRPKKRKGRRAKAPQNDETQ